MVYQQKKNDKKLTLKEKLKKYFDKGKTKPKKNQKKWF